VISLYKTIVVALILYLAMTSCQSPGYNTVLVGDMIAIGNIDKDTVYNGLIRFYHVQSHQLVREGFYMNGVPNGISKTFYKNGRTKYVCNYKNGEINGFSELRDSTGYVITTNYFYHGLPVGPIVQYHKGKIKDYAFYSFDSEVLFKINYDSVVGRRITDLQENFFFYHFKNFQDEDGNDNVATFLYLPNPMKYKFDYDLVTISKKFEVNQVVDTFDNKMPWVTFNSSNKITDSDTYLALRLTVNDSINNLENTMFKVLPSVAK
jgi:hypothetical protein